MRAPIALLAAGFGLLGVPVLAHHSFSAEFDANKAIVLKGVVTRLDWANPHVYFYIDVKDSDGTAVNWACETNGPGGLIRQGWKRDSLKVGEQVTVNGYQARDGSKFMNAGSVTMADGRKVFTGSADEAARQK